MNERKYKTEIQDAEVKIINRETGIPIPDNEPLFILRAKDKKAGETLAFYCGLLDNLNHRQLVVESIKEFDRFEKQNPQLMKEPD